MSDVLLLDDRDEFWTPTMLWAPAGIGKSASAALLVPGAVFIKMSAKTTPADFTGLVQRTTQKESENAG